MAKKTKPANRRRNAELHAAATRLSNRAWANTVADWQELEKVVTQLGAAAREQRRRLSRVACDRFDG